jgi:hypothetical protein
MSEPSTHEHLPKREDLDREARRLARLRHLRVVPDPADGGEPERRVGFWRDRDPEPEPYNAA